MDDVGVQIREHVPNMEMVGVEGRHGHQREHQAGWATQARTAATHSLPSSPLVRSRTLQGWMGRGRNSCGGVLASLTLLDAQGWAARHRRGGGIQGPTWPRGCVTREGFAHLGYHVHSLRGVHGGRDLKSWQLKRMSMKGFGGNGGW
eukprot:4608074-Pyramimonas_sp.AAC.2